MTTKKLHPAVEEFKKFVNQNPKVMEEVRTGKATLQDLFEDWYLLGENDPRWDSCRSGQKKSDSPSEKKTDVIAGILEKLKNMDPNMISSHIGQLSQALGAVQGVLVQFQKGDNQNNTNSNSPQQSNHPFHFRKD